jgi:TRAP-type C4-dicarboxylate transport system permease small subunit
MTPPSYLNIRFMRFFIRILFFIFFFFIIYLSTSLYRNKYLTRIPVENDLPKNCSTSINEYLEKIMSVIWLYSSSKSKHRVQ